MSTIAAEPTNESPETERKATAHTAVLHSRYRDDTGLKSGLIGPKDALRMADYAGTHYSGVTCRATIRLADEQPFYEVAFQGKVYRLLSRPVPGQSERIRSDDVKYELVRTCAPGLQCDGWFMDPPSGVPNTPRALIAELQTVLGASLEDILGTAYSIFHYRLDHNAQYPQTMEPAGYTLRELFLATVAGDGQLSTLYETPKGTNVELWTMFLRELDQPSQPKLSDYAYSSMALKEFGEAGVAAMRQALMLRNRPAQSAAPLGLRSFLEVFPPSLEGSKLTRDVGRHAGTL
ncbi:hypothetical protein [Burkholderia ubonensis]|uniref:hypothetical protein n=1 Tax=Burkholderia ubonensis TaxID=101571 RepID=UPI00075CC25E|nr:hypothetical protein [Burkholderia ubonensis]KVP39826.1 hypothetical protein WJ87_06485 [Burkholderia ubonensis]